jgi:hypothetical protein
METGPRREETARKPEGDAQGRREVDQEPDRAVFGSSREGGIRGRRCRGKKRWEVDG